MNIRVRGSHGGPVTTAVVVSSNNDINDPSTSSTYYNKKKNDDKENQYGTTHYYSLVVLRTIKNHRVAAMAVLLLTMTTTMLRWRLHHSSLSSPTRLLSVQSSPTVSRSRSAATSFTNKNIRTNNIGRERAERIVLKKIEQLEMMQHVDDDTQLESKEEEEEEEEQKKDKKVVAAAAKRRIHNNSNSRGDKRIRSKSLHDDADGEGEDLRDDDAAFKKVSIQSKSTSNGNHDDHDGDANMECRYDGHCPVGTTCAVATSEENPEQRLPGTCLEIPISKEEPTQSCVDACRRELEMDEHFLHEKWPAIIGNDATGSTSGRPGGCVLYFKRTPDRMTTTSIPEWEALRFRHVMRVDPAKPKDNSDDTWMAYCTEPCKTDAHCQPTSPTTPSSAEKPFVCVKGACQRNSAFWEAMTTAQQQQQQQQERQGGEMVIVTGATSDYFFGLQNLMGSIRYWAPHVKVVVYNLGDLNDEQKDWIRQQPNLLSFEWQDGIPDIYPPHVHEGKVYAWKPIIIQETLAKYKMIFWLDAGNTLKGPITPIENIVKRNGIVLFHGQDESMTHMAHEKSYDWFNFSKATMVTGPHVSGNTQAYLSPSRYVESLVNCNAKCALDPSCIAPVGSGLGNHRYDQTTLSLCAYHPKVWPNHHTEYLAASAGQVCSNAREASYRIVYTARQAERAYTDIEGNYLLDQKQAQYQQQRQDSLQQWAATKTTRKAPKKKV